MPFQLRGLEFAGKRELRLRGAELPRRRHRASSRATEPTNGCQIGLADKRNNALWSSGSGAATAVSELMLNVDHLAAPESPGNGRGDLNPWRNRRFEALIT